ncbi:hypothetical protein [Leptospira yasudae]|uniref:hypothetical protein n=1 Tax=Leptospira yasudae TaxID=2202201 RepID=UPI001FC94BC5|nr:hypothetical protein [Leptospira yasudae]
MEQTGIIIQESPDSFLSLLENERRVTVAGALSNAVKISQKVRPAAEERKKFGGNL